MSHANSSLWLRLRRRLSPLVRRVIPSRLAIRGPYATFGDAMAHATGYDAPMVVQQVEEATLAVLEGRAVYERDGIVFDRRPALPMLTAMEPLIGAGSTIADFGGGLGGLYINAPELFPTESRRLVIEQASMVLIGRRLAAAHRLPIEFFDSSDLSALPPVDVLVLSGVLQYLPDPWLLLDDLLARVQPRAVLLDRTAIRRGPSRWYLQINPAFYSEPVTYPVQVLDLQRLLEAFRGYRPVRRWHNAFDPGWPEHLGMLLLRGGASLAATGGDA